MSYRSNDHARENGGGTMRGAARLLVGMSLVSIGGALSVVLMGMLASACAQIAEEGAWILGLVVASVLALGIHLTLLAAGAGVLLSKSWATRPASQVLTLQLYLSVLASLLMVGSMTTGLEFRTAGPAAATWALYACVCFGLRRVIRQSSTDGDPSREPANSDYDS